MLPLSNYKKHKSYLLLTVLALLTASAVAEGKTCSREEAVQAEAAIDTLKTWNSVYRFWKQFSFCDDGDIAEGVSDAVAKLLANRWDSFDEFAKLASNHKTFEKFVVRHIDETIDWSLDAPKIHENAQLHCPANSPRLCKILILRTTPQPRSK